MAKKRDRIGIIGDMLSSIQNKGGEIKPTHLMYKSNLSHTQMQGYLDELVERNLVKKQKRGAKNVILITDLGFKFLDKWREMQAFDETFGIG